MSLVVVATALPARRLGVPFSDVAAQWSVAANLLAGSLIGAWVGASWATRSASRTLYRVLAVLLVLISAALVVTHLGSFHPLDLAPAVRIPVGVVAGFAIGVVAALMGVAGGFVTAMTAGSIVGTALGGFLLGVVADAVLIPLLGLLLVLPAMKVWSHR